MYCWYHEEEKHINKNEMKRNDEFGGLSNKIAILFGQVSVGNRKVAAFKKPWSGTEAIFISCLPGQQVTV